MRNLHQISPELSDLDKAFFWWESRPGYFGELIRYKDLLFRYSEYQKRNLPVPALKGNDIDYVLEMWRKAGSPLVQIKEVFSMVLD